MRTGSFLLIAAAFFAVIAIAAAIAGGLEWAIPIFILACIVAAYALFNRRLVHRELDRHHGDPGEALADDTEGGLPKTHVIGDDETALGDTPEVHAEISPHDFPKGAPERHAAEEMAGQDSRGNPGTTTGHEDPSQREGRTRKEESSQRNA